MSKTLYPSTTQWWGVFVHNMRTVCSLQSKIGEFQGNSQYSCLSSPCYIPAKMRSESLTPSFFCVPMMMSSLYGSHISSKGLFDIFFRCHIAGLFFTPACIGDATFLQKLMWQRTME